MQAEAVHVHREEGQVLPEGQQADVAILVDVALADFHEAAVIAQHADASRNGFASERVEHNVHALTVRGRHDFISEAQRAGIHHMLDAHCLQVRALLVAPGCGKDFATEMPGNLNGREAHATCGGVNQHALAALEVSEVIQRVMSSDKHSGDACALGDAQRRGAFRDHSRRCDDIGAESARSDADDLVTDRELGDPWAACRDGASAVEAKHASAERCLARHLRMECHRDQDISKVHAGRMHGDFDFAGARRASWYRSQHE